jgi:hypothetical protein
MGLPESACSYDGVCLHNLSWQVLLSQYHGHGDRQGREHKPHKHEPKCAARYGVATSVAQVARQWQCCHDEEESTACTAGDVP